MAERVRWGIMGCGGIARKFADCLVVVDGAELAGAASRDLEKATSFAAETGAARAFGSYEELAADESIDAVYVATPHPMHEAAVALALEAGKATLCEKPFAMNRPSAKRSVQLAKQHGAFLMEAMWTRFLPISGQVREWIAGGAIGEPVLASIDFAFQAGFDPQSRLFAPDLGGGGLLDVGVYTIAYANMVFSGLPTRSAGLATFGQTGVDEAAAYVLSYRAGGLAALSCGVRVSTPHTARIDGTAGRITVPNFWQATSATLTPRESEPTTVELAFDRNGFEYEVREVHRCLAAGETESPTMALAETVATAGVMDELRAAWGLCYPME